MIRANKVKTIIITQRFRIFFRMRKTSIIIASLFFAVIAISANRFNVSDNLSHNSDRAVSKDTIDVYGSIIKKHFVNAAGRESESVDYFLEISDTAIIKVSYFIKFSESKITKKFIDDYLKKDFVVKSPGHLLYLRVVLRNGLWDTDDPNVESRIGPYIAIIEVFGCNGK